MFSPPSMLSQRSICLYAIPSQTMIDLFLGGGGVGVDTGCAGATVLGLLVEDIRYSLQDIL